jgi:RND superfamily putative drug exporter
LVPAEPAHSLALPPPAGTTLQAWPRRINISHAETHQTAATTREAMVGLAHSGRVIFAAGAVMVAVFLTFALSGAAAAEGDGIILGIAVLLDALLVQLMLVPVLLRLTGRAAWWLPRWLDRLVPDVRFGH